MLNLLLGKHQKCGTMKAWKCNFGDELEIISDIISEMYLIPDVLFLWALSYGKCSISFDVYLKNLFTCIVSNKLIKCPGNDSFPSRSEVEWT